MWKRTRTMLVLLVLVMGLAACGGGKKGEPTPVPTIPPAEEATQPAPTEAPAPTATPEEAAPAEPAAPAAGVEGLLEKALDAAKEGDWDTVKQELNEALDQTSDAQQKAAIQEILADVDKGAYDEVIEDLGKMLESGGAMDPVASKLDAALDAAKEGDWEKVTEELNEALDLSTDAQQKAAIEEILADVDKGAYDEVVEDLEKLLK